MRDWIVILAIAILSSAVGFWAIRRKPASGSPGEGTSATGRQDTTAGKAAPPSAPQAAPANAPSSTVAAPPALALLEFDGAPGRVSVMRSDVVIGRHSEDDIRVPDVRVSRHHARLVAKRGGGFEIHNLTSVRSEPNPMLINGVVQEHADIADGDIVTLGGVSFTFRLAA